MVPPWSVRTPTNSEGHAITGVTPQLGGNTDGAAETLSVDVGASGITANYNAGNGLITLSPDDKFAYTAGFTEDEIGLYRRNLSDDTLTFVSAVQNGAGGVSELDGVFDVRISSDGAFLYATGQNSHAIVAFSRNAPTGMLTYPGRGGRRECPFTDLDPRR